ncbi:MAG: alpha-amylase [Muribaculaceae bacterium]|nr:alpha-amylase [Muribaculaceae bacterium]
MKRIKILGSLIIAAAAFSGACTSYEIDMPENPAEPVVGNEVSTNVIYQANPRFFATNDCFNALREQLPRISDMGCDILWIMPICEPGELKAFGSPYCIKDFTAVNPRYGTLDDLKALVDVAHTKGMKVMLDWVANHTSWDNPWVTEHPDWYVKDDAGEIISPDGWADVAQLDFSNPEARAAMKEAMLYWVNEVKIDGYRCDYVDGVPSEFWSELNKELQTINPDIIMLAETSHANFYSDGFDMIYDWNSAPAISAAFNGGKASDVITEAKQALSMVPDGKSILRYVLNHDVAAENDVAKMYASADALPAAYVLASMLNGTPMIYSLMDVEGISGKVSFFDYKELAFSETLTSVYKTLNAAFRNSAEVRRGELSDYSTSNVVCFVRAIPGHRLLVAVNTTANVQTVRTPISLAGATMNNLISGTSGTVPVTMDLDAYGYIILMD